MVFCFTKTNPVLKCSAHIHVHGGLCTVYKSNKKEQEKRLKKVQRKTCERMCTAAWKLLTVILMTKMRRMTDKPPIERGK